MSARGLAALVWWAVGSWAVAAAAANAPTASSQQPEVLGRPAKRVAKDASGELLPAETAVLAAPDPASAVVVVLDVPVVVDVLERTPQWLRVRYGNVYGWVALDAGLPAPPPVARPPAPIDPERRALRLDEARDAIEENEKLSESVPGYLWLTDLPEKSLAHGRLRAIATCVDERHRDRYGTQGLTARPTRPDLPPPAVILFAREDDYRRYVERMGELDAYDTGGHAADGVAVLYVGDRDFDDVAATLAHELVHLIDARVFEFELPAWLEEGLAQDFALAAAGSSACPEAGAWPRVRASEYEQVVDGRTQVVRRWRASGEGRAAACAARAWRDGSAGPRVAELLELSREELSEPTGRSWRYVAAAALVRVLVDGTSERRAAFLDWLARRGAGETVELRELLASLGTSVEGVEREMVELLADHVDPRLCDARVAD